MFLWKSKTGKKYCDEFNKQTDYIIIININYRYINYYHINR